MSTFFDTTPAASTWATGAAEQYSANASFGRVVQAVVWSDAKGPDGQPLVDADPDQLVELINRSDYPLLMGHDPGFPVGKVLTAAAFIDPSGTQFVAAILGLYSGGSRLGFGDIGFDAAVPVKAPIRLPDIRAEECWISLAADPREVAPGWLEGITSAAPMRVERTRLSHNAAEHSNELVRIGVIFLALVWNPLVTTVSTEAGKDLYKLIRKWLIRVVGDLRDHKNPILEVQSSVGGCRVSFIIRGANVDENYAAAESISSGAAQAAELVSHLSKRGTPAKSVVYEYHAQSSRWFPSFAELENGQFITDNKHLIAVEKLPVGLSLGLSEGEGRFRLPVTRRNNNDC